MRRLYVTGSQRQGLVLAVEPLDADGGVGVVAVDHVGLEPGVQTTELLTHTKTKLKNALALRTPQNQESSVIQIRG